MYGMIAGNIPSPTTVLASSSPWFTTMSADWIYFAYIAIGIIAAVALIRFLIGIFTHGFDRLTSHYHPTDPSGFPKGTYGSSEREYAHRTNRWDPMGE